MTVTQASYLDQRVTEICAISTSIQQILLSVSHHCLTNVESVYGGFPGHEFALSTRKSSNYHLFDSYVERELALATADAQFMRHEHFQMTSSAPGTSSAAGLSPSKAARLRTTRMKHLKRSLQRKQQHSKNALDEIRWTMAAIRRRKCVHLTKFLYLVDFMQMNVYFAMVLRSVAVVRDHLLRGANALYIRRLTERQDFVMAFHRTLDVPRNNIQDPAAQPDGVSNSKASVTSSGMIPPDKRHMFSLSKQQTKRFLRVALNGKFHMQQSHVSLEDTKSAAVWMESKFEALFLQALIQRTERQVQHGDTFTLDELLTVVELDVAQELVFPPFYGSECCIFLRTGANSGGAQVVVQGEAVTATESDKEDEESARSIAILAPVPLFRAELELVQVTEEHSHKLAYTIKIQPDLAEILLMIRDLLNNCVELFDRIPPLAAHPDLFSILKFSDDVRSSTLEMTGRENGADQASGQQSNDDDDGGGDEDDRRPQNTAERLTERINDNNDYSLLRTHIDQLLANSLEAADQFVECYAHMVELHTQNQLIDYEEIATRFRENEYSLASMTKDVMNLNTQVVDIQALGTDHNVEFLHFNVEELRKSLLPSPLRCLKKLKKLFPSLVHEKCDQFLDFARSACTRIQKPMVANLEAFANYLLHLKVGSFAENTGGLLGTLLILTRYSLFFCVS